MIKSLVATLVVFIATVATTATAKTMTYECRIDDVRSQGYWLPDFLFIGHDMERDVVVVSDPLVLNYNGKPVAGTVRVDNNKRITFVWKLLVKSPGGQRARIAYRATYIKSDGSMSISAVPLGFQDRFTALGRCEVKALK